MALSGGVWLSIEPDEPRLFRLDFLYLKIEQFYTIELHEILREKPVSWLYKQVPRLRLHSDVSKIGRSSAAIIVQIYRPPLKTICEQILLVGAFKMELTHKQFQLMLYILLKLDCQHSHIPNEDGSVVY